jgi:N-acetylmuramoyl-L-alanine amidase
MHYNNHMIASDMFRRWEAILNDSDWYLTIVPEIEEIKKGYKDKSAAEQDAVKKEIYDFFELHIRANDIALDNDPPDADAERKPIDTVVIHHTSNPPGMSRERLSGMELVRLYAPEFAAPKREEDRGMKGRPIYSCHFRDGRQVFWPYHWFVRADGATERLLNDNEIGWQAGNWGVNCRSVAICFDGDFENARPSDIELAAAARIIKEHYPQVARGHIFGHREINPKTTCPSNLFLREVGGRGWKENLIKLLG